MQQLFYAFKERFKDKQRLISIGLILIVLCLTIYRPFGLINYEKFEGNDILIAEREGIANCMTYIKLKENNNFTNREFCFGETEIKGEYKIKNDTIYFDNVKFGRSENHFFKFALIRPSKFYKDNKHFDLVLFKNIKDTMGYDLRITKNELEKLTQKKPNR